MTYTDTQLKQALAKMLPDYGHAMISVDDEIVTHHIYKPDGTEVLDTELLHLCWLVEETLPLHEGFQCYEILESLIWATWQQRVVALADVKGIEI